MHNHEYILNSSYDLFVLLYANIVSDWLIYFDMKESELVERSVCVLSLTMPSLLTSSDFLLTRDDDDDENSKICFSSAFKLR